MRCINVLSLSSHRKQDLLLNDLKPLGLAVKTASETRISNTRTLALISNDYEIHASLSQTVMGGSIV